MKKELKALVIGSGVSGKAAKNLLEFLGYEVFYEKEQEGHFTFDLVVVSPGVPPTNSLYREALDSNSEVIGEVELALRHLDAFVIAITGTNGKTTLTGQITHVLNAHHIPAVALGNIGRAVSEYVLEKMQESLGVSEPEKFDGARKGPFRQKLGGNQKVQTKEVVVLELSSYQIETLRSKCINVGVITNISPDHLERYTSYEQYYQQKIVLKDSLVKGGDFFVGEKELLRAIPSAMYSPDLSVSILRHLGIEKAAILLSLQSFKKEPHRIEFVKRVAGISFFNDSKGTNVEAVLYAIKKLEGKIVLIAGGVDKGSSYMPWDIPFAKKVKKVIAIGEAKEKIQKTITKVPVVFADTLEEAVILGYQEAVSGENVLLSPGCASYDMFENYKCRGDLFKKTVKDLS